MSKGQLDIILIPIVVFILIITIVVTVIILKEFMGEAQIEMPEAYNKTFVAVGYTVDVLDVVAPFIFIGLGLGLIITSYLIYSHPLLYVIGLFSIVIGVIVSASLSNALIEMNATTSVYLGPALTMTMTMSRYLPHILLAIAVIGAIAMYSKGGGSTGGV